VIQQISALSRRRPRVRVPSSRSGSSASKKRKCRFRLKTFGLRYQLGSHSSSRRRIRAPVLRHDEKQIRCLHKGPYCASGGDDQRQPADRHVPCQAGVSHESMAKHEPEGSFQHCFVGLLKASFLVKGENSARQASFLAALVRKRSICAQSTVCDFRFFISTYQ